MTSSLGSTPGIIVGVGVGTAAADALEPVVEPAKQEAWSNNPNRILDTATVARLVAEGGVELGSSAYDTAARDGFAPDKLDALVYLAQTVPAVAEALTLWRRGLISDDLWSHVLVKSGLDARYLSPLAGLKTSEPIDPAAIATMVQRSVLPNPGILPVTFDNTGSNVTPMPQVDADPYAEAAKSGVPKYVLDGLARIVGLPPAPGELLMLLNRGIINEAAYRQGISEGDTRNEWADVLMQLRRRLLSPHDYAELQLRGYIDQQTRDAGAALSGMEPADTELLYDLLGRSIPVHQITTGVARGGVFQGPVDKIPAEYIQSLQRGNLRPEYYNLAYANRYTLPSYFVFRAIIQNGGLTADEASVYFTQLGWPPDLATKAADAFAGTGTAKADSHVTKAQSSLFTATHKSYVANKTSVTAAEEAMDVLGVTPAAQAEVLRLWDAEKALVRKELTATQIKKATDTPYATAADKLTALQAMGYNQTDAQAFLDE